MKGEKLILLILSVAFLVRADERATEPSLGGISQHTAAIYAKADAFLRPLLPIGESKDNIIKRFGSPMREDNYSNQITWLTFRFADNDSGARNAGVSGFEALFVTNLLTEVRPIITDRNDPRPKYLDMSEGKFDSNEPVIRFYLIRKSSQDGFTMIDDRRFQNVGFINTNAADLAIRRAQYTVKKTADGSKFAIAFVLEPEDGEKLDAFTLANVQNRMAIFFDSYLASCPPIRDPIIDNNILMSFDGETYTNVIRLLSLHAAKD
jgi:hypothetical protein